MSAWRVTSANPPRHGPGMDWQRCAKLHNHIIERGWVDSGRSTDDLTRRAWWHYFGREVDLARMEPTMVDFLKAAWHIDNNSISPQHNFHLFLAGLCAYGQMWENGMYTDDEDDRNQRTYLTLYMANWGLRQSRPLGLVYNQRSHTTMQHISMHDIKITTNGRQTWLPLETLLTGLLEMMDEGKVVATTPDYDGEQERLNPWIMPSFSERDLQDSLHAFEHLVDAIESRRPDHDATAPPEHGLFDPAWSDIRPTGGFARCFLEAARVPRFTYLAPGLRVARQQPFQSTLPTDPDLLRPFLLFEGIGPAHRETRRAPWGQDMPTSSFHPEFADVPHLPAGLYLTESEPLASLPFEDGCKLFLPDPIGSNGYARTSDNVQFGEDTISDSPTPVTRLVPRSTQVYQLGFNHYIEMHDVQLRRVLWRWVEMVSSGKWAVDADGVVGGMEKWRDADSAEHWPDYQLPITC
ncbi:hypothetical protein LTR62_007633 [Meristemomyces frigidus]|uniref:Uncharacterized protein n=1 Tax=Meristemomyces frigidus TaxID=1508187 RepID=A0AAN7YMA7_9PEZI|nr:hypothetical protein LTR62_007633 [Meristemomyces frigidus]